MYITLETPLAIYHLLKLKCTLSGRLQLVFPLRVKNNIEKRCYSLPLLVLLKKKKPQVRGHQN